MNKDTDTNQAPKTEMPVRAKSGRTFFDKDDDDELLKLVGEFGDSAHWSQIAHSIAGGNKFNSRQCKERYLNYLSFIQNNVPFTPAEDALLVNQVAQYGSQWPIIKNAFLNRSEESLKIRFKHIQRRNAPPLPHANHQPVVPVQAPVPVPAPTPVDI